MPHSLVMTCSVAEQAVFSASRTLLGRLTDELQLFVHPVGYDASFDLIEAITIEIFNFGIY